LAPAGIVDQQVTGMAAGTALETAVGGITGRPPDDPYGTPARHANRRDFHTTPSPAVVVRQWLGQDEGPGGHPVLLTTAPVEQPWPAFDDDAARRRLEHGGLKAWQPPWERGPPPQAPAPAGRPWAGHAGGASSWSRRGRRGSCWRRAPLGSCLSRKTHSWSASSATIAPQVSAPARTCSPRLGA
jgi:hypothetical protein